MCDKDHGTEQPGARGTEELEMNTMTKGMDMDMENNEHNGNSNNGRANTEDPIGENEPVVRDTNMPDAHGTEKSLVRGTEEQETNRQKAGIRANIILAPRKN